MQIFLVDLIYILTSVRFLLLALSVSCFIKYNIPSELTTAPKRISFDAWGTKTNSHSFMCKIQLYVALNQRQRICCIELHLGENSA